MDSSAVVSLVAAPDAEARILERLLPEPRLHAPHLIDIEVSSALRGMLMGGQITEGRAEEARRRFDLLPLVRYEHVLLLQRIWDLRDSLTPYDASYVALAEALQIPLVTADRHLARSSGHRARIEVLGS